MGYPKCLNSKCRYNDKYLCTTKDVREDIICKQGKADAMKKVKSLQDKKLKF